MAVEGRMNSFPGVWCLSSSGAASLLTFFVILLEGAKGSEDEPILPLCHGEGPHKHLGDTHSTLYFERSSLAGTQGLLIGRGWSASEPQVSNCVPAFPALEFISMHLLT